MESKILVAVDGSAPSLQALKRAAALAASTGEGLRVVTVVSRLPDVLLKVTGGWMIDPDLVVRAQHEQEQAAWKMLQSEVEQAGLDPAHHSLVVERGAAAEEILRLTGEPDISMAVLGTRGAQGRASRILLGSVADRVAHLNPKPVLLVP